MNEDTHEPFTAALQRRAAEISELLPAGGSGTGIVICAGGARIFTSAYVLLHVLRRTLGCRLPIEIWHFGSAELSASMAAALDPFEVELVDAQAFVGRHGLRIHDGWQLKSLAVAASAFDEVLLLDADQVPVTDPAAVFEWPEYAGTGAVFWPDIMDLSESNEVWRVLGLEPAATTSLESGQLLIDRRRHLGTLALAVALNEQAEKLYRLIYGDKDTFLMAWKLTGAAFVIVPHQPYVDERCLVQRDFAGAPLFQHRTNSKWIYAGEQFRIPGAVFETECLAALDELRKKWNGRVFTPPARSVEARSIELELAAAGAAILETCDGEDILEFMPHGEFGKGRDYDRTNWFVADAPDGVSILAFCDRQRTTYEFKRADAHVWRGRRIRLPVVDATLRVGSETSDTLPVRLHAGLVDEFLRAGGFWRDGADNALLEAGLLLLSRVETGVPDRLLELASCPNEEDSPLAHRLRALAHLTKARAEPRGPVRIPSSEVLGKGYVRPRIVEE